MAVGDMDSLALEKQRQVAHVVVYSGLSLLLVLPAFLFIVMFMVLIAMLTTLLAYRNLVGTTVHGVCASRSGRRYCVASEPVLPADFTGGCGFVCVFVGDAATAGGVSTSSDAAATKMPLGLPVVPDE